MQDYIIYGSGGHARVVRDLIEFQGDRVVAEYDTEHPYVAELFTEALLIIAIGNNEIRARIAQEIKHKCGVLIHPRAYVAHHVDIEEGTVILANAVIQSHAKIGKHVIINANVVVDHDATVADYVCTYPGVYIGPTAEVDAFRKIGPNEIISVR